MTTRPTVHASAVLVGARAVLIRGPSGSGKSRLALALLETAASGQSVFTRLVSDDRSHLEAHHGRLLVWAPANLAGLIEVRGLGIRRLPSEPVAVVRLVVDLAAPDGDRLPPPASRQATLEGVVLSRLAVAADAEPLPMVLAALSNPLACGGD
jgi:serine kinase of HPr protein (carbohydrate metabolism regulator)